MKEERGLVCPGCGGAFAFGELTDGGRDGGDGRVMVFGGGGDRLYIGIFARCPGCGRRIAVDAEYVRDRIAAKYVWDGDRSKCRVTLLDTEREEEEEDRKTKEE